MAGSQRQRVLGIKRISDNVYEVLVENTDGKRYTVYVKLEGDIVETPYGSYYLQDISRIETVGETKGRSILGVSWAIDFDSSSGLFKAKLSLKIIDVKVGRGSRVARDDILLLFETMKMIGELKSPCEGIVEEVFVKPGEGVKSGSQLLKLKCK
ncbi:MAG TPA: hypothetical protein EYH59_03800 [Pyrodictium sp.]|nr:hypothetical protein [Pyrodictium sp.]